MPGYLPNNSYKYDDEDYSTIIVAQVKNLGLSFSKGSKGVVLDADNKAVLLAGKTVCYWDILVIHEPGQRMITKINAFEEGLQHLYDWAKGNAPKQHSMQIPLNLITGHWALLQISLDLELKNITISLFDSSAIPLKDLEHDLSEVITEIGERIVKVFEIDRCATQVFKLILQPDDYACGVIVTDSICRQLALEPLVIQNGSGISLSQNDINAIRKRHMELAGDDFAKKQSNDLFIEEGKLAQPNYTADAEAEIAIADTLSKLIDQLPDIIEKTDLNRHIINFISSDPSADSVAAIKVFMKANYQLLLDAKILEKIFDIKTDTKPEDDFIWRPDGGKDTLEKILRTLCAEKHLTAVENQDQDDSSSDSEDSDEDSEETTEVIIVSDNYRMKGQISKDEKPHGLCREKFYDESLSKYCTFTGLFYNGSKVSGVEESVHRRFNIDTYFKGTFVRDSFQTGNIRCIIGDGLVNDQYIVGFDGKLEDGVAKAIGILYVFTPDNNTKYKIIAEFNGQTFQILCTDLSDILLLQTVTKYFADNFASFCLRSNDMCENDLNRIRIETISSELRKIDARAESELGRPPMPLMLNDYDEKLRKRARLTIEPDPVPVSISPKLDS